MDLDESGWLDLYRAALLEFDPAKLGERVTQAQKAVEQRIRELTLAPAHAAERQALIDALHSLKVLREEENRKR